MSAKKKVRDRNFSITYHYEQDKIYLDEAEENLLAMPSKYLCYSYEEGKDGRVHIQAVATFENKTSYDQIHQWCPGIWVAKCKASLATNINYCSKLDTHIAGPYEWGTRPCQGYRSDLVVQCEMIKNGSTPMQVVAEHPIASRNYKCLMIYQAAITNRDRNIPPVVHIRYGATGTGKTKWCYDTWDESVFRVSYVKGGSWWDGYGNQKCILFDDWPLISDESIYFLLLMVTDRYNCMVPFKGGMTSLGTGAIVITTNDPPNTWFGGRGLQALERRITSVTRVE